MGRSKKKDKEIIDLLRSGDFTIAYHDNGVCSLYKGKHCYDELPEKEVASFDHDDGFGYTPNIVIFLVQALKGNFDSI